MKAVILLLAVLISITSYGGGGSRGYAVRYSRPYHPPKPMHHHKSPSNHYGSYHHGGYYRGGGYYRSKPWIWNWSWGNAIRCSRPYPLPSHHGGYYRDGGYYRSKTWVWNWSWGSGVSSYCYSIGPSVIVPSTTVVSSVVVQVQNPVVAQLPQPTIIVDKKEQVWIEGKYIQVLLPDGTYDRRWQPGHYE